MVYNERIEENIHNEASFSSIVSEIKENMYFMDCILLCMKHQVINIIAVNTTLFFNNLFVV
jgi:hypothetical protein